MRSTKRLAITNNVVPMINTALMMGKSRAKIDSINRFPTPGMPKNRSTMNEVNAIPAKENPKEVTTGIKAFRKM